MKLKFGIVVASNFPKLLTFSPEQLLYMINQLNSSDEWDVKVFLEKLLKTLEEG